MKVLSATAAALLAGSAVAAPAELQNKLSARRVARRSARPSSWKTGLPLKVGYKNLSDTFKTNKDADSSPTYDSNWAGGVITTSGINSVTATFTVPTVSEPSGGSSGTDYGAAAWVGIDGDSCQSAILQTGISFTIQNGQAAYSGWYEWYPAPSTPYSGFSVNAGDQIKATVVASSTTSGTATLENLTTGQTVNQQFTGQPALCLQDAEWIVEDFEENGSLVPFANFGSVTFSGASYETNGNSNGVSGAQILDVQGSSGTVETNCAVSGSNTISCQYTG